MSHYSLQDKIPFLWATHDQASQWISTIYIIDFGFLDQDCISHTLQSHPHYINMRHLHPFGLTLGSWEVESMTKLFSSSSSTPLKPEVITLIQQSSLLQWWCAGIVCQGSAACSGLNLENLTNLITTSQHNRVASIQQQQHQSPSSVTCVCQYPFMPVISRPETLPDSLKQVASRLPPTTEWPVNPLWYLMWLRDRVIRTLLDHPTFQQLHTKLHSSSQGTPSSSSSASYAILIPSPKPSSQQHQASASSSSTAAAATAVEPVIPRTLSELLDASRLIINDSNELFCSRSMVCLYSLALACPTSLLSEHVYLKQTPVWFIPEVQK